MLGRLFLLPIILITLTGVYLSLLRFNVLPKYKAKHHINYETLKETPQLNVSEFVIFKDIPLSKVQSVEFPFSKSVDDFYTIKLTDRTLVVNQFTGELLSQIPQAKIKHWSNWSIALHTGQGSVVWSLVLLSSCISILFFIYSGFTMTFKRRKNRLAIKNIYNKDYSEFIILVGSETGNTYKFAKLLYNALLKASKTVYISNLNTYTSYKEAKHLIVLTSTYGDGESPTSAAKFQERFKAIKIKNTLQYAVVGFGSKAYKHYCKFAEEVQSTFKENNSLKPTTELCKINNQSYNQFKDWVTEWTKAIDISLELNQLDLPVKHKKETAFSVVSRTPLNIDSTFLIRLKPQKKVKFKSGDLLSLIPKEDGVERLYSVW